LTNQPIDQKRYFHLGDEQRLNWLRLIRSQNVGPATFRDLISHYGTAAAALEALPELAERGGAAARIKICPIEDAEREMARCENAGTRFIAIGELDPRSEGTNGLIKQGATLITSTDDIIDALAPLDPAAGEFIYDISEDTDELPFETEQSVVQTTDDAIRNAIISSLGPSPTEIDDIIRFTSATPGQVQLVLMELALAGRLERHTGNRVSLT